MGGNCFGILDCHYEQGNEAILPFLELDMRRAPPVTVKLSVVNDGSPKRGEWAVKVKQPVQPQQGGAAFLKKNAADGGCQKLPRPSTSNMV